MKKIEKFLKDLTWDWDPVLVFVMCLMAMMLLSGIVGGILAACGVFDGGHDGLVCIQQTLTHHVKVGDEWDCTKYGPRP